MLRPCVPHWIRWPSWRGGSISFTSTPMRFSAQDRQLRRRQWPRGGKEGLRKARRLGAQAGINLGSSGIVCAQRERLWQLLREPLFDVIMLNEDEAKALFSEDASPREVCANLSEFCQLVVLTLGSKGLYVANGGEVEFNSVEAIHEVVDSTGAGDFFAGGFLAAWLRQQLASCTPWGYEAAAAVLRIFGTELGPEGWQQLRASCSELA
ncbi:pfkB, partial [Symbiodinium pilosum]